MGVLQVLLLASLLEPATLGESYTSNKILPDYVVVDVNQCVFDFLCIFFFEINQV